MLLEHVIEKIQDLGKKMAKERDVHKLLESILISAKEITNCDGGTLYIPSEDRKYLQFEIVINDGLDYKISKATSNNMPFPDLDLYTFHGSPNLENMATASFIEQKVINIENVTTENNYNMYGVKLFDKQNRYHTQSILTIPLIATNQNTLGVIQLINAYNDDGKYDKFSNTNIVIAEFLAFHASATILNFNNTNKLITLFESVSRVIATAIDDKSPYTGNHCHRVPEISAMIAEAALKSKSGKLKNYNPTFGELYEIKLAALLHDCGKVTTPVNIVDKATKLETIYDRIENIETKFEVLKKNLEIKRLRYQISALKNNISVNEIEEQRFKQATMVINNDLEFLKNINIGSEFMNKDDIKRVDTIAKYEWNGTDGVKTSILTKDELENLKIEKGTLNTRERNIINHHIVMTQKMLGELDFPEQLKNIPDIAGNHHEKINGTGHPKGLKGDEISISARILCIADIFEALTAQDRPYKKGKTISESLFILGKMTENGEIDEDLFKLFIEDKLYLKYAHKYLAPYQINNVNISEIPGYTYSETAKTIKISNLDKKAVRKKRAA